MVNVPVRPDLEGGRQLLVRYAMSDDGVENTAFEPPPRQHGKVQRGWRASHSSASSFFVFRMILKNHVDCFVCRHFALDTVEETNELLVKMALQVLLDDRLSSTLRAGNSVVGS